jgi:hypothetical protein
MSISAISTSQIISNEFKNAYAAMSHYLSSQPTSLEAAAIALGGAFFVNKGMDKFSKTNARLNETERKLQDADSQLDILRNHQAMAAPCFNRPPIFVPLALNPFQASVRPEESGR